MADDVIHERYICVTPGAGPLADEQVVAMERKLRLSWEKERLPIRSQTPWITFDSDTARKIEIDESGELARLRLPNGRFLRVRPWKVFGSNVLRDAEYMRDKVIALAAGLEPPDPDLDFGHWLETFRRQVAEMNDL